MQIRKIRPASAAEAWLALGALPGVGPRTARDLAERMGGPEAVLGASAARLAGEGLAPEAVAAIPQAVAQGATEAAAVRAQGARLIVWTAPEYPDRLRAITDPPLVLVVRGDLGGDEPSVAIVGARRASAYGRRIAEELAAGLAQAGVTVVSGLAAGVDAAAHRGALAAGGRTVGVLGTGIDRVYPSWHAELARDVAGQGALVTEFPCGTEPRDYNFPRRNRIIAGLTLGTIVVEAAARSGSLITARHALEHGREVFAVPGLLGSSLAQGPHELIRAGATLVRSADDVLEAIAPSLQTRLESARATRAAAMLDAGERRVLAAVGPAGTHVDDVIRQCALSSAEALEVLLALELRGLVAQEPGKRFRTRAPEVAA